MTEYKLVWSPNAKEEYAQLLKYIEQWYGTNAALHFLEQVDKIIGSIEIFPYAFPTSHKVPNFRKAVITKQASIFYKINNKTIEILHFWDNRQDLQ
jgi:plasmid stabilization system protein ParE